MSFLRMFRIRPASQLSVSYYFILTFPPRKSFYKYRNLLKDWIVLSRAMKGEIRYLYIL